MENEKQPKDASGRSWGLRLAIFIVGGAVLAVVNRHGSGGEHDTPPLPIAASATKAADIAVMSRTAPPTRSPVVSSPTRQPARHATPHETLAGVGDTVRDGQFSFRVKEAGTTNSFSNDFGTAQPHGKFVVVFLRVENTGDEARDFSPDNQHLYDSRGRRYDTDIDNLLYAPKDALGYEQLNPGINLTGAVVFDVPKNARIDRIELHDTPWSDGAVIRLT